ncbi:conserved hypothetical protein [Pediculus humanus corporis]|uniref:Uncharacterized protein n=1 Tax=Pediculus humanus subsp. corporis TaxID=121224 RepID=E0VH01_PEDHC|nr:uncharacterized protein Phum_PHUM196030 [Pediculus humanus corporis]EEB12657.1 conserved hypothetical protein [Pediculus humanus corporis]
MLLSFAFFLIPVVAVTGQQFNNAVRNGYLPPVSPSSSTSPSDSLFKAEQSRQSIELSEKDAPLCSYEDSKSGLCSHDDKKIQNIFDSINSKLEKFSSPKATVQTVKETTKPNYSKFNGDGSTVAFEILNPRTDNVIPVTTIKPTIPTTITTTTTKFKNDLFANNKIEESRAYLPPVPEYSGAAQTLDSAVKVPQREPQNNNNNDDHHHHHHHHHHDENFDICSDPFHSFLCAPLKARKRITGALPERLGQPSFNEFRNVLFPSKKPSLINNEPKLSSPSNIIESTSFKPTTTTTSKPTFLPTFLTTKFQGENSNVNDRFYLPPVLPGNQNFNSFPVRPESSNTVTQTTKFQSSSSIFNSPQTTFLNNFHSNNLNDQNKIFQPTTEKKYLNDLVNNVQNVKFDQVPVKKTNLLPSNTITTKNQFLSSSSATFSKQPETTSNPFLKNNDRSQQENSFLSSLGPNLFNTKKSSTSFASNIISSVPSVTFNNKKPDDNNEKITTFSSSFVPTNVPNLFTDISVSGKGQPTFTPTSTAFNNFASSSKSTLPPAANFIATTLRPFSEKNSLLSSSVTNNILRTNQNEQSSPFSSNVPLNLNNEYSSTISKSQNQLTTTIKPFTTTPSKSVTTSTKIIEKFTINNLIPTAQQSNPAVTSQGNPQTLVQTENYEKSLLFKNNNDGNVICNDSFQNFLCAKKDVAGVTGNVLTKSTETFNGVNAEIKPSSTFQSLTTQTNLPQNTVRNGFSQNQYKPSSTRGDSSSLFTTSGSDEGYTYPKPSTVFPLPTKTKSTFLPVTTYKPTTKFITNDFSESNEQKSFTGYNYPKPPEPLLPQTDEQKNFEIIKTTSVKYDYPKPERKFLLPTEESRTVTQKTTLSSSSSSSSSSPTNTPSASTNIASKGYFYPKPQESLELPQKKGYDYPKPKNQLKLPAEKEFKPLFSDLRQLLWKLINWTKEAATGATVTPTGIRHC